jgi:hypothetical protein
MCVTRVLLDEETILFDDTRVLLYDETELVNNKRALLDDERALLDNTTVRMYDKSVSLFETNIKILLSNKYFSLQYLHTGMSSGQTTKLDKQCVFCFSKEHNLPNSLFPHTLYATNDAIFRLGVL